jgi:glutaconate CoA-transferase subunit B
MMVVAAARQIRDGQTVNVGMRLPLIAFAVAKKTHAPNAIGMFDAGIVRTAPIDQAFFTMCDPVNVRGSIWITDMIRLMHWMQAGHVDLGFLGGAEVDRFGNLNTSYIGDMHRPRVKLPGSGGAADIAGLAHHTVIIMPHERHRLVPEVHYITSLGYGRDGQARNVQGPSGGGPQALVTSLGVFAFDPVVHDAVLQWIYPGVTVREVREHTGWPLKVAEDLSELPPPTTDEWKALNAVDPDGFWTAS